MSAGGSDPASRGKVASPSGPAILVVDDHPANRLALQAVLAPLGHRIVQASSGQEALDHVVEDHFALVLLDVQMPGLDGLETASRIQADPRSTGVPIIFVTAINRDLAHILKGYSHGAVDYLLKPIDPEVLRSKASAFVELYQKGAREASRRDDEHKRTNEWNARLLAESELRYRSLVLATSSIVWTADTSGSFVEDSPSWMAFTGQGPEEHRGLGWLSAIHPEDREAAERTWRHAVASIEPYAAEGRLRRSDGTFAFVSTHAVPIFNPDGSVREWIGAVTDITARKAAEHERERVYELERQAHAMAEQAVRIRDDFFAMASHELNTPLAPLKLQVDMMRLETDLAGVHARAATMARQIDRFGALVTRLLDVTRMTGGRLLLEPEPFDLAALVRDVVARFQPEAEASGCALEGEAPPSVIANLDRLRIEQVLTNLLTNALKFGQGRPVDVVLEQRDGQANLRVTDHGIGIAPRSHARIFEQFERATGAGSHKGFGLGLWIVRQIVEASGGRVTVDSQIGEGSTFVVELPLSRKEASHAGSVDDGVCAESGGSPRGVGPRPVVQES
jgi:PAS domain S-box-containing protein